MLGPRRLAHVKPHGVQGLFPGKAHQPGASRRGCKDTRGGGGVKPLLVDSLPHCPPNLVGQVVCSHRRRQELTPGDAPLLSQGHESGEDRRARVHDGIPVGVVEVHAVGECPIDQGCIVGRKHLLPPYHTARTLLAVGQILSALQHRRAGLGELASTQGNPQEVQKELLCAVNHLR